MTAEIIRFPKPRKRKSRKKAPETRLTAAERRVLVRVLRRLLAD